jgi:hypothetical protein
MDVFTGPLQRAPSPHLARDFLDEGPIAELALRGEIGGFRLLATFDPIARRHLQMRPDLVVELAIAIAALAREPRPWAHAGPSLPLGFSRPAIADATSVDVERLLPSAKAVAMKPAEAFARSAHPAFRLLRCGRRARWPLDLSTSRRLNGGSVCIGVGSQKVPR